LATLFPAALALGGEPETPDAEPAEGEAAVLTDAGTARDDDLDLDPSAGSVTGALQGKEGVRIQTLCTHCNSANIQVGGLSQDLVPMERDGYPLLGGLATSFVMSFLPADSIVEAQVVKGPGAAVEPSTAAGGVIRLQEAVPEEIPWVDLAYETGTYDLEQETVRLAGPLTSWLSGSAVFGTGRADAVDDDGDGWVDVPMVDRKFADAHLTFRPGLDHSIDIAASWVEEDNLEGRGAFDALASGLGGPPRWTREDTYLDRMEYRAGWVWPFLRGGSLSIRGLHADRDQSVRSQFTADPRQPAALRELVERYQIEEVQNWGALRFERPLGIAFRMAAGVEAIHERVTVRETDPFLSGSSDDGDGTTDYVKTWSGYVEGAWTPSHRWELQAGVRHDDDELFGSQTSPRATLRIFPGNAWALKLIGGRTFRPPKPIFAEVCCGQRYQSNTFVEAEDGRTVGLEAVFQPRPAFRASLYTARTDFDNHILRLAGWTQFYTQVYALANVPDARAETAELALRWEPVPGLTLDGSYGVLSFHNEGEELVGVPVYPFSFGGAEPPTVLVPMDRIPYNATRSGSLGLSHQFLGGVRLAGQATYTGSMLIQEFDLLGPRFLRPPLFRFDGMRETPGFWLASFSAGVPLARGLELSVAVDNLTNRIQNDLGDPTTDYNWGPLAGRSYRVGSDPGGGRGRYLPVQRPQGVQGGGAGRQAADDRLPHELVSGMPPDGEDHVAGRAGADRAPGIRPRLRGRREECHPGAPLRRRALPDDPLRERRG
jgi:outer membrane receptor protein involved in Fe transport